MELPLVCGLIIKPWQLVPKCLDKLLAQEDPVKSQQVMDALMKMEKIDIKTL